MKVPLLDVRTYAARVTRKPARGERRLVQYVGGWDMPEPRSLETDDVVDVEEWDGERWQRVERMTYGEYLRRRDG